LKYLLVMLLMPALATAQPAPAPTPDYGTELVICLREKRILTLNLGTEIARSRQCLTILDESLTYADKLQRVLRAEKRRARRCKR
jgi:hypothetical protein